MTRFVAFIFALAACAAWAADVPQWRGNRTGVYSETGLLKSWPEGGPKMLWAAKNLGTGFSGPCVVDGVLYITGLSEDGKREKLFALDKKGNTLWDIEYGSAWTKSFPDARTMPFIKDGKAYIISGCGEIVKIDLKKRAVEWSFDAMKEYKGRPRDWGYAENPLVACGKIFMTVGGTKAGMIALDAETGKPAWAGEPFNRHAAYVSPIAVERNGKTQIIGGAIGLIFGADAETGETLWKQEVVKLGTGGFENEKVWETNVALPVYKDGRLFVSSGNNYGCYMLELPEWKGTPKVVWTDPEFDTHHGGDVLLDGRIYGPTWINNDRGGWACHEWDGGKKIYNMEWPRHSKGSIVAADGMLYVYEEKRGQVALVKPGSDKFEVVGSFKLPMGTGRHWCHPVISDGTLYIRRGKVLMAFDIRDEKRGANQAAPRSSP